MVEGKKTGKQTIFSVVVDLTTGTSLAGMDLGVKAIDRPPNALERVDHLDFEFGPRSA